MADNWRKHLKCGAVGECEKIPRTEKITNKYTTRQIEEERNLLWTLKRRRRREGIRDAFIERYGYLVQIMKVSMDAGKKSIKRKRQRYITKNKYKQRDVISEKKNYVSMMEMALCGRKF